MARKDITALWLSEQITDTSPEGIANTIVNLVHNQKIAVGTTLPKVTDLAKQLDVSTGTISNAMSLLRVQRFIMGSGRQGITVTASRVDLKPQRFTDFSFSGLSNTNGKLNLTYLGQDLSLYPDMQAAVNYALKQPLNSYKNSSIVPALRNAVIPSWPYLAEEFIAIDGVFELIPVLLNQIIFADSCIAVADPTYIFLIDILALHNIKTVPVPCDDNGMIPAALASVLEAHHPVAVIYQIRTAAPDGSRINEQRMSQIAGVMENHSTLAIELDTLVELSHYAANSLATYFPDRVIHVRSYLKTYGPALSLAILSAPKPIIKQLQNHRGFTTIGWSNRLLQETLAYMLTDKTAVQQVINARQINQNRRKALIKAIQARNVSIRAGNDGLCLWLPVKSEALALAQFEANNITVIGGSRFTLNRDNLPPHVRLATSTVTPELVERVAEVVCKIIKA